ncbi:MAG: hypothetical protein AB1758_09520 [Candidatus Eremiobacterota bacterium]
MRYAIALAALLLLAPATLPAEESAPRPARSTSAQRGPRISLDVVRADLPVVIKKIGQTMGCNVYVGSEVQGEVTLSVKNVPAEGMLALVLRMQPERYDYKLVGNTLVVGSPERVGSIPANLLNP